MNKIVIVVLIMFSQAGAFVFENHVSVPVNVLVDNKESQSGTVAPNDYMVIKVTADNNFHGFYVAPKNPAGADADSRIANGSFSLGRDPLKSFGDSLKSDNTVVEFVVDPANSKGVTLLRGAQSTKKSS